jgi:hypothetical protein
MPLSMITLIAENHPSDDNINKDVKYLVLSGQDPSLCAQEDSHFGAWPESSVMLSEGKHLGSEP